MQRHGVPIRKRPSGPYEITSEMVSDVFTTAIDPGYGGSLYWAEIWRIRDPDLTDILIIGHLDFLESDGKTYVGETLENGGWFAIGEFGGDWGGPDIDWHPIDRVRMRTGIEKAMKHYHQTSEQFMNALDAGTADVALQFAVLGDIIYG